MYTERNANKYTFVWRKAVQKRLDILPSKLAILKQDIWNELGLETHCMNDECIYTFLAKEIEVQHMELVQIHSRRFTFVVADAGYDSHENLTWLKNNHYLSCIKPQYYEKAKTRAWTKDISKARNMKYIPEEDAFICAKGRKLKYAFTHNAQTKTGFISERKVYICESCNRCEYKNDCQRYVKPTTVNPVKRIETTPAYDTVLTENQDRLLSDTGIQLRINTPLFTAKQTA